MDANDAEMMDDPMAPLMDDKKDMDDQKEEEKDPDVEFDENRCDG